MAVNTVDRRRGNAYGQVALGKIHCSRNDWLCARNCSNWEFYRQIQVMSTLPLKAVSRLWGRFNELEIPYYLRVPGFKLYSWIFGVK